jgi:thiaminase/transcriptional activator TenA
MTRSFELTSQLRGGCDDVWQALHEHPFIREMADGTLPLDKFRFYIEQNLMYLPEYARAIAIGAARSRDVTELGRAAAALTNIVDVELPQNELLRRRAVDLGAADRGGRLAMAPATVAYTSYLISAAFQGGPLEVMTVIMPCAWSYGDIASHIDAPADHPVYRDWIAFFAGDEYTELVERMRGELEELGGRATPTERARLQELFTMGTRLEMSFWDMAYGLEQWPDVAVPDGEVQAVAT